MRMRLFSRDPRQLRDLGDARDASRKKKTFFAMTPLNFVPVPKRVAEL